MFPEQIKNFREMITLKDGTYVLLRPMTQEDHELLVEYYSAISDEDLRYLRHPVKDPNLIKQWCDQLDYGRTLPLLAIVKDRVVGTATLHFFEGPKRHVGEVRILLSRDFRKRGLGIKMTRALVDLARKHGLSMLYAEIIADMSKVVKAFEQIGFTSRTTLDDFFMFPDGDCADVVVMTMPLRPKTEEF